MIICKVKGHVWATKKEDTLVGLKLMVVQELKDGRAVGGDFVAADVVSAGVGDRVLVVNGSTARRALGRDEIAIDSTIVGVIDSLEVDREKSQSK